MKEESGFIDVNILKRALDKYGSRMQTEIIQEECIELALVLQKFKRINSSIERDARIIDIIDKIADVSIVIKMTGIIYPIDLINSRIDFKMDRLLKRLTKGFENKNA